MHTHRHTHQLLEVHVPSLSGIATMYEYVSECMCGKYTITVSWYHTVQSLNDLLSLISGFALYRNSLDF